MGVLLHEPADQSLRVSPCVLLLLRADVLLSIGGAWVLSAGGYRTSRQQYVAQTGDPGHTARHEAGDGRHSEAGFSSHRQSGTSAGCTAGYSRPTG
jgi:hypothetical protein